MGRASISIAITSNFNSRGIDQAIAAAERLAVAAVHHQGTFGKAAVDMGASMGQAGARLVSMGKSVAALGDKLTAGVTVPMGLAAAAAVMSAAKIDTAWYNVRKTVDMTEEGYQRLKEGAMALSEVQPVTAETILNIEALGGQLGITNESLESFAKIVSGLDISTNLSSDEAATQLAQFRNIVQMSEDDLDNFASTVVDLGNHTATTEADIMQLALRFASAGHVAGMSNQEILGISAALAGLGMKAEAGGSALSRVINDIGVAVDTNGEHLEAWAQLAGRSVDDFKRAWKEDAAGTFEDVLKGIAAAGDEMNATLEDVGVTQIRTSDAMRRLASSGDLMSESIQRANRAWSENTALQREVDNRNESLQARWDTLVNRFTNDLARLGQPIAEMGLDALGALEPVIGGITEVTQAFAQADPAVQRFAFNLGAVAMAAGPVLSVTGRVMQAVGNMGQRVGRATQQWGVYQDALHTTDMSMLTTLSNNKSLAAQFGASRNPIVKAAGGLDRFNVAYAKTTDSIRKNIDQQVRQTAYQDAFNEAMAKGTKTEEECARAAEKAAHSRETQAEVTRKQKAAIKELNDSIDESNVAAKLNVKNVTEQEIAASKASRTFGKMGDAIKGAFLGFGALALTGAAVAGITWLVTQFQVAAERAENLRLATSGLRESLTRTTESAEEQNRVWGSSIAAVDQAIEKQAQLGQVFEQNNTAAQTSINTLDRAAATIRDYGNRSDLSASEMLRLKSAMETVNDALGIQGAILEDGTVALQDETGAWQENKQAILDNIEARKQQIRMQAAEANYQSAYEQELTTKKALKEAQTEFNDALERYNELKSRDYKTLNGDERTEYRQILENLGPLRDALERAREAAQAAGESTAYWDRELQRLSETSQAAAGSLEQMLSTNTNFAVAFEGAKHSLSEFAAACQDLGINFDSLNVLGPEVANNIASAFDGTAQSVVEALKGAGDQGQTILTNIGNNWYGSFSAATQGIIGSVAAMKGMTLAELSALAADMGVRGEQAVNAFMRAMDAGFDPGKAAEIARQFDDAFDDGLDPAVAAEAAKAFVQALSENLTVEEALQRAQEAIEQMKSTLSGASFSEAAKGKGTEFFAALGAELQQGALDSSLVWSDTGRALGRILPDGTVQGIGEGAVNIPNAVQGMVDGAKPGLDSLAPYALQSGTNAGLGFDSGLSIGGQGVGGTASGMIASLMGILMGGVGQAQGIGSDTGTGYGTGVGNQGGTAEYAAMQTLGRLLIIWLTGIASAQQAGARTGQAYSQGLASSAMPGVQFVQAAVQTIVSLMNAGVGPATAAGQAMGSGFGQSLSQMMLAAATFTQAAMTSILSIMRAGVAPATAAGRSVGTGFRSGLQAGATPAISVARAISVSAGSAFGAGRGAAAAGGSALGSAFAAAVRSSAQAAVGYAQSIRAQVQSIFDSIPTTKTVTLNVKTNVQKVAKAAALPSQTPAFQLGPGGTIAPFAGATRAAATAERAAVRIRAAREAANPGATLMNVATNAVRSSGASVDYDTLQRVVRSGVMEAIRDSGGLAPTIELDGRAVSRQLASHMDYELGRLDRMRG